MRSSEEYRSAENSVAKTTLEYNSGRIDTVAVRRVEQSKGFGNDALTLKTSLIAMSGDPAKT